MTELNLCRLGIAMKKTKTFFFAKNLPVFFPAIGNVNIDDWFKIKNHRLINGAAQFCSQQNALLHSYIIYIIAKCIIAC